MSLTKKELKEIIVELKIDLLRTKVLTGHCPLAYYPTYSNMERNEMDCNNLDCDECSNKFFENVKDLIKQEVMNL